MSHIVCEYLLSISIPVYVILSEAKNLYGDAVFLRDSSLRSE